MRAEQQSWTIRWPRRRHDNIVVFALQERLVAEAACEAQQHIAGAPVG
jgi:hypothetical protein